MSNLTVRILTAVIAGTVVVAGIWSSPWGLFVICLALSVLGIIEFYKITGVRWWPAYAVAGLFAMVVWFWLGIICLGNTEGINPFDHGNLLTDLWNLNREKEVTAGALLIWLGLMFFLAIASLFRKSTHDPLREIAIMGMGYFYAFLPFVIFFWILQYQVGVLSEDFLKDSLRSIEQKNGFPISNFPSFSTIPTYQPLYRHSALGILFLFWTLDSFAYFGGRLFGKHKLFERISPKKTWEGSLIGAAFCIGLGVLLQFVWPVDWNWIVVAAIISVTGQLGDLVESMFKRSLALKDSGGLLPGHGGILDRFDGFIISMPFIALYHLLTQWF